MDIKAIKDNIEILEDADTTPDNVRELAYLYIVKDHITAGLNRVDTALNDEVNDIFPYYKKYIDIKTRYQRNQTTESEVIQGMKDVCRELKEFIKQLYCNTDMNKERILIKKMLTEITFEYCDK